MELKETRQRVAEEAARLIYDEGYRDYRLAKLKAAQRLGAATQGKNQPGNEEIERALLDYISLFADEEQRSILRQHREIAVEAMEFLHSFEPQLTGAALTGTSGPHSAVTLFLYANRAEDVIFSWKRPAFRSRLMNARYVLARSRIITHCCVFMWMTLKWNCWFFRITASVNKPLKPDYRQGNKIR
ncbi:MAG: hypothetical protein R3E89_12220 [Thiolinea sp.]